jgi:hypothetical protein
MSSGGRLGARFLLPWPRRAALAGGRLPREAVERVPERAGDRPPRVEVGTHPTFARPSFQKPH